MVAAQRRPRGENPEGVPDPLRRGRGIGDLGVRIAEPVVRAGDAVADEAAHGRPVERRALLFIAEQRDCRVERERRGAIHELHDAHQSAP